MTTGDHELFEKKYGSNYSSGNVIHFLALDPEYGNSILSSLRAARENARSVREIISSEMWEQINRYYIELRDAAQTDFPNRNPHKFFKIITMRGHMFTGLLYSTMSHGEAFRFALTGLMLERADKTSRILDVKYFMLLPKGGEVNSPYDSIQWAAVLKVSQVHPVLPEKSGAVAAQDIGQPGGNGVQPCGKEPGTVVCGHRLFRYR